MTAWNDIVVGFCILLLGVLLWKEFRRPDRSRLVIRVIATILAVAGLAGLILPFSFRKKATAAGEEAVLLTEGYDPDSVRAFLQTAPEGTAIFLTPEAAGPRTAVAYPLTGATYPFAAPGVRRWHVFGYGLTTEEWDMYHPPSLSVHPSSDAVGIVSVGWPQKLWPGEKLRIQGSLHNPGGKPMKLIVRGEGTTLDSVETGDYFQLNTIPAQSGRVVYQLMVLRDGGKVEQEDIPVEVLPAKALKILLLAASPDFENRFLVSWLAQDNNAVAVRTAISKEKYDKAYLNMAEQSLDRLTPALLDKFDVVIADATALQAVSAPELSNLRRAVAEKGLGVIIKADSAGTSLGGAAGLVTVRDSMQLFIKETPGTQALMRDSLSRVLVSSGLYGAGKVLLTTRNDMYARLLGGNKKEYAAWWTRLLRNAVREDGPLEDWQWAPSLPRVSQPVHVLLQTNKDGLPQGLMGTAEADSGAAVDAMVYLGQCPLLPFRWEGSYWPERAGWQTSRTLQGDTCWWYAWKMHDWQSLYRRQRWEQTREYAASQGRGRARKGDAQEGNSNGGDGTGAEAQGRDAQDLIAEERGEGLREAAPKAWFYALFIVSCIGLWIEKKI